MTTTRRTLIDELTPYTLTADEGAAVRTGFDLALRTRYQEAHVAVCDLSEEALRDALLAHTMFGSMLRFELAGREFGRSFTGRDQGRSTSVDGNDRPTVEQVTIAALAPDSLRVPCGRCGHDETVHEDEEPGTAPRCCLDCGGFCAPVVLVPAHVTGWAIEGRARPTFDPDDVFGPNRDGGA